MEKGSVHPKASLKDKKKLVGRDPKTKISGTLNRTEKVSNICTENPKLNKGTIIGESCGMPIRICGICMDMKAKEEMFKSSCSHAFCRECIGSHVAAKISENIVEVKCPDLGCKVFFDPDDCRSIVPQRVLDRWEIAILESLLGPNKFYCPFRDCSGLMVVDNRDQCLTLAECPYCHRLFCARCHVPWHAGSRCKPVKDCCLDAKFEMLARKKRWQKCPSCKSHVERIGGCAGIRCRCGYKFCYLCGSPWSLGHVCTVESFVIHFIIVVILSILTAILVCQFPCF